MSLAKQVAQHIREVHYGGNSTGVNLQDTLQDLTWQQANTQVHGLNTITTLLHHTNYYVHLVLQVLKGGPLVGNDKLSFIYDPIQSQEDWDRLLEKIWAEADEFARAVENMKDEQVFENFSDGKYGNNYRNVAGLIEHLHYHLGQMVIIKKIILQTEN